MAYSEVHDEDVVYCLRDKNQALVDTWTENFAEYPDEIKVSQGDIFEGAPAVDAVVSPGNCFGFMNGNIDSYINRHFGSQMQTNLQKLIRQKYGGELLLGKAVIVPIGQYGDGSKAANGGVPIKYMIYAPSMRTPIIVASTPNAYLAFRGVILAISKHNRKPDVHKIRTVLVPGLGTSAGGMPVDRCAWQMLQAYETTHVLGKHGSRLAPTSLAEVISDSYKMSSFGSGVGSFSRRLTATVLDDDDDDDVDLSSVLDL